MYDDLVKRLRAQADAERYFVGEDMLYDKAADAIEELTRENKELSFRAAQLEAMNDALIGETGAADALMVVSQPRWIPVSERLPDTMKDRSIYSGWSAEIAPSDDVLCYLGSEKRQTVAWFSHTYEEWTTVDENTVYKYGEVTHWMPLPERPKEE